MDIFTINETRLDESISDAEVSIEGHNLYRKGRCRSGGGVAIYTRDVLNVRERFQLAPKDIEAVCLEIVKSKCKPMLVTSIYRPPNSKVDFMDQLENYFNILDEQNKELIITGNLNCDLSLLILQPHSCRLIDILELFQLKQLIVDPTRITSNTESLLDIMATNRPDKVQDSGVIQIGISDYSLVYLCLKIFIPRYKPKIVESRNLKNYNNSCFNHHLYYLLSNSKWDLKDPNKLWDQFNKKYL